MTLIQLPAGSVPPVKLSAIHSSNTDISSCWLFFFRQLDAREVFDYGGIVFKAMA
jgi:hypothetical protein